MMNNTEASILSAFERQDDDSDWEYEYDDVETEVDFVSYVQLPFTEHD